MQGQQSDRGSKELGHRRKKLVQLAASIFKFISIIIGFFHIAANRLDKRVTLRYENINIKTMIKKKPIDS
jgi:hypothetical protein